MSEIVLIQPREIGELVKRALRAVQVPASWILPAMRLFTHAEVEHQSGLTSLLRLLESGPLDYRNARRQDTEHRVAFDCLSLHPVFAGPNLFDLLADQTKRRGGLTVQLTSCVLDWPIWEALLNQIADQGLCAQLSWTGISSYDVIIRARPASQRADLLTLGLDAGQAAHFGDLTLAIGNPATSEKNIEFDHIRSGADRDLLWRRSYAESIAVAQPVWQAAKSAAAKILVPVQEKSA